MMAIAAYGSQKEDDLSTEDTLGAHGEAGRVPISQIAGISWRENGSQSWLRDIDFIASSACTGQTWICSFSFVWTNSEHQKENEHTDVVATEDWKVQNRGWGMWILSLPVDDLLDKLFGT